MFAVHSFRRNLAREKRKTKQEKEIKIKKEPVASLLALFSLVNFHALRQELVYQNYFLFARNNSETHIFVCYTKRKGDGYMRIGASEVQRVIALIEEQYPHFDIRSVKGHPAHGSILEATNENTKQKVVLYLGLVDKMFVLYQDTESRTEVIGRLYGKKEWDERQNQVSTFGETDVEKLLYTYRRALTVLAQTTEQDVKNHVNCTYQEYVKRVAKEHLELALPLKLKCNMEQGLQNL